MKQVLQNLRNGNSTIADVPCPAVRHGQLLIRTHVSLISSGTERMLVEFGSASVLEKARQQPDKVRMLLDKVRTDGLMPALEAVHDKLDRLLPLGYCNVGTVIEVGPEVSGFRIGELVASNGQHAEVVSVPANLCAKVPDGVSEEAAAFTVLGAVALQGIRLARPTLGEAFVVTGLGLIGLLAVQLLRAHGCRVLGLDLSPERAELARKFGAETVDLSIGEDPIAIAKSFSRGRGVDGVILAASTQSNEPVRQAAQMCRKRGRIVLVGMTGLELSRADFYEKELTFQVSCSYGPGRYDPEYEQKGRDYPVGFVRWTEQRNFEALLDMIKERRIDPAPLVSHRFSLGQAPDAYALIAGEAPSLGVLLIYPQDEIRKDSAVLERTVRLNAGRQGTASVPTVGFVGAGNYASRILIPAFKDTGARLKSVASAGGVSGLHAGRKHGFEETTTDIERILADDEIDTVAIATRHDTHAKLVCRALAAGKNVFVEKPLCLTLDELQQIHDTYSALSTQHSPSPLLMVGFNRRFAPQVGKIKSLLEDTKGPKCIVMTVNAGVIPTDHWTHDPTVGGGRIVGEACHFVDLLRFLVGVPITYHSGSRMEDVTADTMTIQLGFSDGSIGTIHYLANGNKSFPKERLEIFASGRVLQLDNFRKLAGFGWPEFSKMNLWRQDKGQKACAAAFVRAVGQGGEAPIGFNELMEVSRVTIAVA